MGATTPPPGWAQTAGHGYRSPPTPSAWWGGRPTWSHRPRPHPLSCRHLQTQPLPAASPRIGGTALIPSEPRPVPPQLGAPPPHRTEQVAGSPSSPPNSGLCPTPSSEQPPPRVSRRQRTVRHAGVTLVLSCPRGQRKAQPLPRPPGGVGKGPEAPPPPGRAGKPGEPLPGCAPAPPPPRNASILQTPTSRAVGPEPRTVQPLSGSTWTASIHLPQTAIMLPRKHKIRTHDLHGDIKAGGEPPSPCSWRLCSALESSLAI